MLQHLQAIDRTIRLADYSAELRDRITQGLASAPGRATCFDGRIAGSHPFSAKRMASDDQRVQPPHQFDGFDGCVRSRCSHGVRPVLNEYGGYRNVNGEDKYYSRWPARHLSPKTSLLR